MHEELERLEARLAAFPTTEAQDARLLEGGGLVPAELWQCARLLSDIWQKLKCQSIIYSSAST